MEQLASKDVIRTAADWLDFIEHHTAGLVDPEQPYDSSQESYQNHRLVIWRWQLEDVIVLDTIRRVILMLHCDLLRWRWSHNLCVGRSLGRGFLHHDVELSLRRENEARSALTNLCQPSAVQIVTREENSEIVIDYIEVIWKWENNCTVVEEMGRKRFGQAREDRSQKPDIGWSWCSKSIDWWR